MPLQVIRTLGTLLLVAFVPAPEQTAQPVKWTVTVATSGGLRGQGLGSVAAVFDGRAATARLTRPCARPLTTSQIKPLASAVAAAKAQAWRPSYAHPDNPDGCCDQFRYTMTLDMQHGDAAAEKYRTAWYSSAVTVLPADVRAVFDAAWALKKGAEAACGKT